MSRINTNVSAMIGSRILNTNNQALNKSLERLSTGLRINRGADDPAGLIASENLRKQITGVEAAIKNADRAVNIVGTAEGALIEVSALLLDLQGLLTEVANTGGMSSEEIDANQLQVDSIINSINRIANTTEFEGIKLLNGNLAYTTSTPATFASYVDEATINSAKLIDGATMTVVIARTSAANTGRMFLSGATVSTSDLTLQIGSGRGTTDLTFAAGTTVANVRTAINAVSEVTGVSAAMHSTSTTRLALRSKDFGSDAYVSVKLLANGSGTTNPALMRILNESLTATTDGRDYGVDVIATVNGTSATGDGKKLTIRTSMLEAELDLDPTAALSAADWNITFGVTGGGADFALGALVEANAIESLGIQNIASTQLGDATDGYLNTIKSGGTNNLSSANLYTAQKIVSNAIKDVSTLRGRLGSFQKNVVETTLNSLKITKENLSAAESAIRDTDFATETATLTRNQILVNAATSVLAQANYAPQSVLSLLG
ncbi:MAG: hypothetical protein JW709_11610 [Sedimentisphaerales bacterium]|nr:hypothetical protein [Sedimentisphaerales bacterium]